MEVNVAEVNAVQLVAESKKAARKVAKKSRAAKVAGLEANVDGVQAYQTKKGVKFFAQVRTKLVKQGKTFSTRKEALDWKRAMEGKTEVQVAVPAKMTLPQLFDTYVQQSAAHGNAMGEAIEGMFTRLSAHRNLATLLVSQADHRTIKAYCIARKVEDGVSITTIQGEFVRIDLALKHVGDWLGWTKFNPLEGLRAKLRKENLIADSNERKRRPRGDELPRIIDYLMDREVEALERGDKNVIPMADLVRFASVNAFRRGEIATLRWDDRTENGIHCWRKDATCKEESPTTKKGKRLCLVPLLDAAREVLERQPRVDGQPLIFPYKPDTVSHRFTEACKALGIIDLRFHDLRHEAITNVAQHVGTAEGMMVSGHKTPKHFLRYVNMTDEEAGKISKKCAPIKVKDALAISGDVSATRAINLGPAEIASLKALLAAAEANT